jgi:hypothetical protein
VAVQISILVRQKGVIVAFGIKVRISRIVESHKSFLLFCFSNVFDWVSSPYLTLFDYSSRRDYTVRSNDGSFLQDGSFQNDRVMPDVHSLLDCAGVKGAIILDDVISFQEKLSPKTSGRSCSRMKDAIVPDADIID